MQCSCHPQLQTSLLLGPPTLARNDEVQLPRRSECVDCREFRRFRGGAIRYGECKRGTKRPTGSATPYHLTDSAPIEPSGIARHSNSHSTASSTLVNTRAFTH
jgi:hypothetical protein